METLEKLETEFVGTGEVKGMIFKQLIRNENHAIYEVNNNNSIHYEVIKIEKSRKMIDFTNKIFSENDFKEIYPKSKKFGTLGKTFYDKQKAYVFYNSVS